MRRKLVLSDGTRERELLLVGRIVVGRDPGCEISHDDSLLSRRHAEFVTVGTVVTVRDLGSRNGVFVNGTRAVEQVLAPGDVVQIGPLRARFVLEDSPTVINPDTADVDQTAVIRKVFNPAGTGPVPAAALAVAAATGDDDEDVTRMVPAPRMPLPAPAPARPAAPPPIDDDGPTRFIDSSEINLDALAGAAPAGVSAPPMAPAAVVLEGFRSFVFFRVLFGAVVILAGAALPILQWRRALTEAGLEGVAAMPLAWFAPSFGIALIVTYVLANSINRRAAGSLAEGGRGRR